MQVIQEQPNRPKAPIVPRKMRFAFEELATPFFYDGNALVSSLMATLSATFPPGEREFVRSVNAFRDAVEDPALLAEIKAFSAQEGHHAHQHRLANRVLDALGYRATDVTEHLEKEIDEFTADRSDAVRLAFTVTLEHLTAIMAHHMLANQEILEPLPEAVRELLLWHAVEEIEHKAVAFDVYEECVGDRNLLRQVCAIQTFMFVVHVRAYQRWMLEEMGYRPTLRDRLGSLRFFFGKQGLIPGILGAYLDFYRKDFHPWDRDDRPLVEEWKKQHGEKPAGDL